MKRAAPILLAGYLSLDLFNAHFKSSLLLFITMQVLLISLKLPDIILILSYLKRHINYLSTQTLCSRCSRPNSTIPHPAAVCHPPPIIAHH